MSSAGGKADVASLNLRFLPICMRGSDTAPEPAGKDVTYAMQSLQDVNRDGPRGFVMPEIEPNCAPNTVG